MDKTMQQLKVASPYSGVLTREQFLCFVVLQVNKKHKGALKTMASIRKRGSNSYLIVVSRGYDYEGNRLKSVQKTVKPPKEYTPKQAEKWVKETGNFV